MMFKLIVQSKLKRYTYTDCILWELDVNTLTQKLQYGFMNAEFLSQLSSW